MTKIYIQNLNLIIVQDPQSLELEELFFQSPSGTWSDLRIEIEWIQKSKTVTRSTFFLNMEKELQEEKSYCTTPNKYLALLGKLVEIKHYMVRPFNFAQSNENLKKSLCIPSLSKYYWLIFFILGMVYKVITQYSA